MRERHILLPVGNPVNPYPDLKSYIPEEYYDFPKNHEGLVEVAPGIFILTQRISQSRSFCVTERR